MTLVVTPSDKDVPLIRDVQGTPQEIRERVEAFFKTAEFLEHAGAELDIGPEERKEARELFSDSPLAPTTPSSSGVAYQLKALLTEYDYQVLDSNIQARNYIVNRLLDISNPNFKKGRSPEGEEVIVEPAKVSEQIKALELLGKVSEIGLFTERVEVSINNKSTEELEDELVQTLVKYMGNVVPADQKENDIVDIDLDKELGRNA